MRKEFVQKECISSRTWQSLREKFYNEFTQSDLRACYHSRIPVFVRHNNRNVYAHVYLLDDCSRFFVSDFYRLTRDGTPVRLYVGLD